MEYKYINLFLLFIIVILITMNYNLSNRQEQFINHSERHNSNIRAALNNQTDKERERKKRDRVLKANLEEGTNYVQDSESLQDMFKAVSNSEALCDELENNQKNRDMIEQYKINESTLRELSDQKKRINELRKVVNYLRTEKMKRQTVSDKCRVESQKNLNKDYKLVQKLSEQGLLGDESIKVNLNVSDSLKKLRRQNVNVNKNTAANNNVGNVLVANNNNSNNTNNNSSPTPSDVRGRNTSSLDTPRFAQKKCPYINKNKFIHKDDLKDKCVGCDVNSITKNYPYLMKDFA
jgi:hypothetical protein